MEAALSLIGEIPRAHLVVGIVGPVGDRQDRTLGPLFEDLIDAQGAQGAYGVGEVQDGDHLTLRCAFQLKADADRFAASLLATTVSRYPGFASQRQFLVSTGVLRAISSVVEARR